MEGEYRYHVWVERDGTPAETIFRNPIVDERKPGLTRQYASPEHGVQKAFTKAWEMLW